MTKVLIEFKDGINENVLNMIEQKLNELYGVVKVERVKTTIINDKLGQVERLERVK